LKRIRSLDITTSSGALNRAVPSCAPVKDELEKASLCRLVFSLHFQYTRRKKMSQSVNGSCRPTDCHEVGEPS
jgi:hypothetical protein